MTPSDSAPSVALPVAPIIIPRSDHCISRANISRNALKVLYRLKDAGYQAFIVGGGVRDLLLNRSPKDFDIATNASPEDVRALFGNCRLIGRRFRLAHVRFRDEIIEVATFRGTGSEDLDSDERQVLDESGRIIRDNSFGSIEEDAWRRDFTVNAIYYNIADFSIWDFVGGVADIKARSIRLIGDPETRYREDPVRMVRAVRFAAKLGLSVHPDSAAPIGRLAPLIDGVPSARLFDEFLKVFQTGHALASFRELRRHGLFEHLFPLTAAWLAAATDGRREAFIERALRDTDRRIEEGLPVTPMFLFGVLLWGPMRDRMQKLQQSEGLADVESMINAGLDVTTEQVQRIALPRRFSVPMREMFQMQLRLARTTGRRVGVTLAHRRFRAAFDLLVLRTELGEVPDDLVEFWRKAEAGAPPAAMPGATESEPRRFRSGRRRGRQRRSQAEPGSV